MRQISIVSLLLTVFVAVVGLRADDAPIADDAPTGDTQQQFDAADTELQQTDAELARQQAALNDLLARQSGSSQDLASSLTAANTARQSVYDAQAQLYSATSNQSVLDQLADDKRNAFDQAKAQADSAAQALDRYRQAQMAQFDASPGMKQATANVSAARQSQQQAATSAHQRLLSTFEYADAYDQLQHAGEVARAQRAMNPPDPAAVAQADADWLAASQKLDSLVNQTIQSDPQVVQATEKVSSAMKARQALMNQFNASLLMDPVYQQLSESASVYASNASSAADDLNAAEAQRTQNAEQVQELQSIVASSNAQLAAAEHAIAAYQGPADNFGFEVSLCQAQIDQLYRQRFSAWRRRQWCAQRLGFHTNWHDWDSGRWNRSHRGNRGGRDGGVWTSRDRNGSDNGQPTADDRRTTTSVVVPYGPQPPKAVVPYGPQPDASRVVFPYGPQPSKPATVAPYGPQPVDPSAKSSVVIVRRKARSSNPPNDADHERAVMRQGPQPAPKSSANSSRSQASPDKGSPEPRNRGNDSNPHSAPPTHSESNHRSDPGPRNDPAPRAAPAPRYDSPHESAGGGSRGGGGSNTSHGGDDSSSHKK